MEKREKYRQKINFSFFRKKKGRRKGEKCSKIRPNDPMGRVLECSLYTPSIFQQQHKSVREAVYRGHPGFYHHRALLTAVT